MIILNQTNNPALGVLKNIEIWKLKYLKMQSISRHSKVHFPQAISGFFPSDQKWLINKIINLNKQVIVLKLGQNDL